MNYHKNQDLNNKSLVSDKKYFFMMIRFRLAWSGEPKNKHRER